MYFNFKEPQFSYRLIASNLPGENPKGDPLCFVFPLPFPLIYQQVLLALLQMLARLILYVRNGSQHFPALNSPPLSRGTGTPYTLFSMSVQALCELASACLILSHICRPFPSTLYSLPRGHPVPGTCYTHFFPWGRSYSFSICLESSYDIKYMSGSNATVKKDFHHLI